MLVLDTDHLSFLQNDWSKEAARLTHRLDQAVGEWYATTIVTYEELKSRLKTLADMSNHHVAEIVRIR